MKAVILCDGSPPEPSMLKRSLEQSSLFIAADGGALTARSFGVVPDIITGDFDSYRPAENEKSEVIYDPDQETNDLEKALSCAIKRGATETIIYGATGKRLDHTLKNLSVLKQFDPLFKSILLRDRYTDISLVTSPYKTELPLQTLVSLFPLSGKVEGITTRGLQYPLVDEDLENGVRDGTSNKTVKNQVEIEFKKGDLLLFVNHQTEEL